MKISIVCSLLLIYGLFLLSCNDHMKPCFLRNYPLIVLTNFDTTELDSIKIIKYDSRYLFDSVVESKMMPLLSFKYHNLAKDSFTLSQFMYSDVHVAYDASSLYNFEFKFGNNRVVKLKNFQYKKTECDNHDGGSSGCWCEYLGCTVESGNCTTLLLDKDIFVSP